MAAEPWRYRCPECGSTQIRSNDNSGGGVRGSGRFYCNYCQSTPETRIDAKLGQEVTS